jgi:hypothetical protein
MSFPGDTKKSDKVVTANYGGNHLTTVAPAGMAAKSPSF